MFNSKSIYALNKKDPDAIVYTDADGTLVRLTRENFTSEDEFQKWKAWSDEDYHGDEKAVHILSNHARPLSYLDNAEAIPSPEEALVADIDAEQAQLERAEYCATQIAKVKACLTEKQYRRLWMLHVKGMSVQAIADAEKVTNASISESISAAEKKIQKYFPKQAKTP